MKYLVLGFSAAGANAVETLRRLQPEAEITVVSADRREFYLRLDLEGIFHGKTAADLTPRPPTYWDENGIVVVKERALAIDPPQREVRLADERTIRYDRLLVATGAEPRKLAVPGHSLEGVVAYHTLDDAELICASRERVRRIVIVGGGILGLELARAVVSFGWETTILVRGGHVGSPTVDPSGSPIITKSLERAGVNMIYRDQVAEFEGEADCLVAVRTTEGRRLEAEMAVVCIGVVPAVSFLAGTGILTNGKLIVDDRLRTPVENVYAAGDVAVVRTAEGREIACNTWTVASAQARVAAGNMCGQDQPWEEGVLYNLDSLFDREFTKIGPWDERRTPGRTIHEFHEPERYSALVVRDGILESAFLLGDRSGDRRLRKLISRQARVAGKIERVLDPDVPVEEFR
ncbi:FAD-dependent oxidoreductase [bacterium]|nr:FAD-dependent oxidoreductase [bacterium]MBU1985230.1 FAD-dependent oxidoreductase [bacterium]